MNPRYDLFTSIFLTVFSIFILYNLRELPYNSAYYPRFLIGLFMAASLCLMIRAVYRIFHTRSSVAAGQTIHMHTRSLALAALSGIYIVCLPHIGYVVTTAGFIPLMTWILGVRSWRVLILIPVITTGVLYITFTRLLMVPLPAGLFF